MNKRSASFGRKRRSNVKLLQENERKTLVNLEMKLMGVLNALLREEEYGDSCTELTVYNTVQYKAVESTVNNMC